MKEALQRACKAVGGQTALARAIGTSQARVWYWINTSGRAPAEMAHDIARVSGVSMEELRPDIFKTGAQDG